MTLSNTFLRLGVLFAVVGMSLGYWMGSTQNFVAAPVHAHINLLGWVSMFLYGLFYRANPGAASGWLPRVHLWFAVIGLLIFMPALAIELLPVPSMMSLAVPGLIVGPTLTLLSMLMFAVIVFRNTSGRTDVGAVA